MAQSFNLIKLILESVRPQARLSVSDWSNKYRILSTRSAAEPGPYRWERTPYMREIMDCLSDDSPIQDIVFMKAAQVGATEAGNNWIGYSIDHAPAPFLLVQPTVELAKRNSKQRIEPLIEDCPKLGEKVKDKRSRDSGNTVLQKDFPGGTLVMTGANSAVGLRSIPAKKIFFDEVDAYPSDADGEGSPITLAKARSRTFGRKRKHFYTSTPLLAGRSEIERLFEKSDQRYFEVPCPLCGEFQVLIFPQLKWEKDNPAGAWYQCSECNGRIENWQKTKMLSAGQWRATVKSEIAGFHLNALYSPVGWYSWGEMAVDFVESKKSPELLRSFVNTVLAETWKEKTERPDWRRLYDRREKYKIGRVPAGAVFLTAGVDVQEDRFEMEVVGWGPGKESWSVDYRVIQGDTSKKETWDALDKVLNETWPREDNERVSLPLLRVAIDSGYNTQAVYNGVRAFSPTKVIAIKGRDNQQVIIDTPRPVDVKTAGGKLWRGLKVWSVGVSVIKTEFYGWLRLPAPTETEKTQPGYCHFPEYGEEFFKMLTAEELVARFVKGFKRVEWQKSRERNEALDCRVYARAAAAAIGIDRFNETNWREMAGESATIEDSAKPKRELNITRRRNKWL